MTYEEAKAFLADCNRYAGEITLAPLERLLELLGDPQEETTYVHIAGTNGKGSVLAYVSSALRDAGRRVGRYISPTIFSYRERIQVNEEYISREALARLTARIREAGERMLAAGEGHPTMFEAETALAFLYFAEQKCDLVVLETGMGGTTDATNVIRRTAAAVISSVSMDHIGVLGNTLGEIAGHKAGIIKPGCRVVSAAQEPEAEEVIREKAAQEGCPVTWTDLPSLVVRRRGLDGQAFDYRGRRQVEISLAGEYQFRNAALALDALDALRESGYAVPEEAVRSGLKRAAWPARFSVIAREPLFLLDGAHNPDAARMLRESVERDLPGRRLVFIMGVLADKEYEEVVRRTVPLAAEVVTVMTPDNPRALPAEELAETVRKYNGRVRVSSGLSEAVETAYSLAGREDAILAFGSLSYLGELARIVERRNGQGGTAWKI
ncbi:MAG: folylpolyglutamate synthase/dihydrofolate synthase family protein [Eubacteriales bacterium]|nr:folylpolyglutamate synthase/dihydrofolate synthase family protein [Eubacteriales bacterium]